ncbi:COX15-CtaA-domain-containing protein [Violaceomyces palustris]|uniref:COX15-CtaA-domain-containing protein n=1 Tax=Violaceomyces palustris TaxID=1673888 RepID=A0ACD0NTI1_9BASI|nr:COX15-CtaA-domain-containing protein [Violaceomyces palustris]
MTLIISPISSTRLGFNLCKGFANTIAAPKPFLNQPSSSNLLLLKRLSLPSTPPNTLGVRLASTTNSFNLLRFHHAHSPFLPHTSPLTKAAAAATPSLSSIAAKRFISSPSIANHATISTVDAPFPQTPAEPCSSPNSVAPASSPSSSSSSTTTTTATGRLTRPSVAIHLYCLAFLVYAIVVVGGLTRLTESGLSITEWNPGFKGMWLPTTTEGWESEWEKYKLTPEFQLLNRNMSLEDFKTIYLWEWSHRILGRLIGVAFVVPSVFFLTRGWVSRRTSWKIVAIASGIGFQGFLGWFMVKSGLSTPEAHRTDEGRSETGSGQKPSQWTPRVNHFRLAAHLGTAFLVYLAMLHTGLSIQKDYKLATGKGTVGGVNVADNQALAKLKAALEHPLVRRHARLTAIIAGLVFTTAMSGALVAGLDAGLVYNEFPTMGQGRILPPTQELLDESLCLKPDKSDKVWMNLTQNQVTIQAMHRVLAISSLVSVLYLTVRTRRISRLLPRLTCSSTTPSTSPSALQLPPLIPKLSYLCSAAAVAQASLGIATLVYMVPIPLASAHQAGSLALLSCLIAMIVAMRRPLPISRMISTNLKPNLSKRA